MQIFFREKVQDEEGYVLFVRKNALQILIPKYGLEGTLYLSQSKGTEPKISFVYCEEVRNVDNEGIQVLNKMSTLSSYCFAESHAILRRYCFSHVRPRNRTIEFGSK